MKTALELKEKRNKLFVEYEHYKNVIDGQYRYIEGKIDSTEINRNSKYIDLGNIEICKENIIKLLSFGFYIIQEKNGHAKIFFDSNDYNQYLKKQKEI